MALRIEGKGITAEWMDLDNLKQHIVISDYLKQINVLTKFFDGTPTKHLHYEDVRKIFDPGEAENIYRHRSRAPVLQSA